MGYNFSYLILIVGSFFFFVEVGGLFILLSSSFSLHDFLLSYEVQNWTKLKLDNFISTEHKSISCKYKIKLLLKVSVQASLLFFYSHYCWLIKFCKLTQMKNLLFWIVVVRIFESETLFITNLYNVLQSKPNFQHSLILFCLYMLYVILIQCLIQYKHYKS